MLVFTATVAFGDEGILKLNVQLLNTDPWGITDIGALKVLLVDIVAMLTALAVTAVAGGQGLIGFDTVSMELSHPSNICDIFLWSSDDNSSS